MHHGIDLAAGYGSPIRTAAVGTVTTVGDADDRYGLKIIIQHPYDAAEQFETLYTRLINLPLDHLKAMLPTPGKTIQPRPVRLCAKFPLPSRRVAA